MTSPEETSGSGESPGPGRQPLSHDDLLKIVRAAEDEIRRDSFETLLVFDQTGQEILRKFGQRDNVQVTPAERRQMRGQIVTHNHPHGWTFPPPILATRDTRFRCRTCRWRSAGPSRRCV